MSKSNNSSVILFCVIFGAIILSLFVLNINRIKTVLQETRFVESVFGDDASGVGSSKSTEKHGITDLTSDPAIAETPEPPVSVQVATPLHTNTEPIVDITTVNETTGNEEPLLVFKQQEEEPPAETELDTTDSTPIAAEEPQQNVQTSPVKLFFMYIDSSGNLIRKETERNLPLSTSPLTASITALINGPNTEESDKGYISLIPQGTRLLSASIKDKVAYLNFSDDFQWNKYGVEGYFGQLMQIVYTATTYSTVSSVQFLIDGQKQDYLGSEGVWIGTPLSRTNLR